MRELIKEEQLVTIVPQDFKNTNNGKVLEVSMDGFRMILEYKPVGLVINHICDFYSLTNNGYLYFESYIKSLENNVITIANPIKHRFLQRRQFTRIKYLTNIDLVDDDNNKFPARTLDLSAGGMKISTESNLNIEKEYKVNLVLSDEIVINCRYKLIRVEKGADNKYTISGSFTHLSNVDKMSMVQYCMQKDMENHNK